MCKAEKRVGSKVHPREHVINRQHKYIICVACKIDVEVGRVDIEFEDVNGMEMLKWWSVGSDLKGDERNVYFRGRWTNVPREYNEDMD
jgi:hypothetical protein